MKLGAGGFQLRAVVEHCVGLAALHVSDAAAFALWVVVGGCMGIKNCVYMGFTSFFFF